MNKICKTLGLIFLTAPVSVFCSECTQNDKVNFVKVYFQNGSQYEEPLDQSTDSQSAASSSIEKQTKINSEYFNKSVKDFSKICSEGGVIHSQKEFNNSWNAIKENFMIMRNSLLPRTFFESHIKNFAESMNMPSKDVENNIFLRHRSKTSGLYWLKKFFKNKFNGPLNGPHLRKNSAKWKRSINTPVKPPKQISSTAASTVLLNILSPNQNTTNIDFLLKQKALEPDNKNSNFKFCSVPQAFNPFADKKK